jgi:hypothetical protein
LYRRYSRSGGIPVSKLICCGVNPLSLIASIDASTSAAACAKSSALGAAFFFFGFFLCPPAAPGAAAPRQFHAPRHREDLNDRILLMGPAKCWAEAHKFLPQG